MLNQLLSHYWYSAWRHEQGRQATWGSKGSLDWGAPSGEWWTARR